jgi:pimeloyl-ACP methyl ester carboxylesterase
MDGAGIDRARLVGWSVGVDVAFAFARRHPERVAGILAVGGQPGDPFRILFGPTGVLRELREPLGRVGAWALRFVGRPVAAAASMLVPFLHAARVVVSAAGVPAPPGLLATSAVAQEFAAHTWTWCSRLVLAAGDQEPMGTSFATFPVTVVAGVLDNPRFRRQPPPDREGPAGRSVRLAARWPLPAPAVPRPALPRAARPRRAH